MLLYGKMRKLAELSNFWQILALSKKMVLAVKFAPLDQTIPTSELSKQKYLLISGEEDSSMLHHLGCRKWQKHGENLTPNDL